MNIVTRLALCALIVGVLIFLVLQSINLADVANLLLNFSKLNFLALCSVSLIIAILKSWRFLIILDNSGVDISFWETLKVSIAGQAASSIPGGGAIRSVLIKSETGTKLSSTIGPLIAQSYIEILSASVLVIIGSFFFGILRIAATFVILTILLFGVVLISENLFKKVYKFFHFLSLEKLHKRLLIAQKNLREIVIEDKSKVFIRILVISIFTHLIGGGLIFIIARTFSVELNFFESLFIYTSSVVIQGLSVTPGGVGFTESGMSGVLLLFGVDFGKGVGMILIFRLVTLIFYILTGVLSLLIFYSKPYFKGRLI